MEKLINLAKALKAFEVEEISIGLSKGELEEIETSVSEFMDYSGFIVNYDYPEENTLYFKIFGVRMTFYVHKKITPVLPNMEPFIGDVLDTKKSENTDRYKKSFK